MAYKMKYTNGKKADISAFPFKGPQGGVAAIEDSPAKFTGDTFKGWNTEEAGEGAKKGAAAGMMFGPWGAVIGGAIGGVWGGLANKKDWAEKDRQKRLKRRRY